MARRGREGFFFIGNFFFIFPYGRLNTIIGVPYCTRINSVGSFIEIVIGDATGERYSARTRSTTARWSIIFFFIKFYRILSIARGTVRAFVFACPRRRRRSYYACIGRVRGRYSRVRDERFASRPLHVFNRDSIEITRRLNCKIYAVL